MKNDDDGPDSGPAGGPGRMTEPEVLQVAALARAKGVRYEIFRTGHDDGLGKVVWDFGACSIWLRSERTQSAHRFNDCKAALELLESIEAGAWS